MQQSHKKCHEDIHQHLSRLKTKLFECAAQHVTSYDKCAAQQKTAKVGLMLHYLMVFCTCFSQHVSQGSSICSTYAAYT